MRVVSDWTQLVVLVGGQGAPWLAAAGASLLLPTPLDAVLAALFSTILGSWLHEAGHVAAYWWTRGALEPVVVRSVWGFLATSVAVPRPGNHARLVALGGPLPVAALGVVVGVIAWATALPGLWGAAVALGLHGAGLLPGASDGNRLWGLEAG